MFERKSDILSCNSKAYDELHNTAVLIHAIKTCCQTREFLGEYYGIPQDFTEMLSNERNEYISLLSMTSDKLDKLKDLNLSLERELSLLQ